VNYPSFFIANSKRQELTTTAIFLVYSRSLLSIILKKIMEIKFKYTVKMAAYTVRITGWSLKKKS
jgi:hypothetical protein